MSKFLTIFIKLIIIFLCHQVLSINAVETRISGGNPTTINRNKYVVSLRRTDGTFFCGGSLVKNRYVVTAAHCVKGLNASDFNVHGGIEYLNQEGVKRSVDNIFVSKDFNNQTLSTDVAILKLSKPMQGRNIETIPLCSHKLPVGGRVKISGWGKTNENNINPSNQLRTTQLQIISHKKCEDIFRGQAKITRTNICALGGGKRDTCAGDSGSPMVHRGQLCGIVSFGVGCARNYPSVYTSVNTVKKFILRAMTK